MGLGGSVASYLEYIVNTSMNIEYASLDKNWKYKSAVNFMQILEELQGKSYVKNLTDNIDNEREYREFKEIIERSVNETLWKSLADNSPLRHSAWSNALRRMSKYISLTASNE